MRAEGTSFPSEFHIQFHAGAPLALDPFGQFPQASRQVSVRFGQPRTEQFQLADVGTEIPLLYGDRLLNVREAFPGGLRLPFHHAVDRLQLQGGPGQGLQQPVMQVAGKTNAFFHGCRLLELFQQIELIQLDAVWRATIAPSTKSSESIRALSSANSRPSTCFP